MDEDQPELSQWTLGDFAASKLGLQLEGQCIEPGCGGFTWFNLASLIELFGAGYRIPMILPGAKCQECGGPLKFAVSVPHESDDGNTGEIG